MMKLWAMPALLLAAAMPWPKNAVTAITGLSCEHKIVWVCSNPGPTATATIRLNAVAQQSTRNTQLPLSYLGAAGSLSIQATPPVRGVSTLITSTSQPTELLLGASQDPSAIFYLDVPRLPPWPRRPLDLKPPVTNIAPPSTFAASSPQVYWNAIVRANHQEADPSFVLPRNYYKLPPADQLFVLTNLERIVHGLWPLYGVSPSLNRSAQAGIQRGTDPSLAGTNVSAWGSNWYSGAGALQATFSWMYDDGYGSQNIDCHRPGAMGCWGHRANILGNWGPYGLFGGAVEKHLFGKSGTAEVFRLNLSPTTAKHITYTWRQAVKAGARPSGF